MKVFEVKPVEYTCCLKFTLLKANSSQQFEVQMDMRTLWLSVLFPMIMVTLVHAQPQYRVTVSPPATVSNIPSTIREDTTVIILCFRETDNTDGDLTYCPLGQYTVMDADFQPEELPLRQGSDGIDAAYPTRRTVGSNPMTIFPGVGVIVTIRGIRDADNTTVALTVLLFGRIGGAPGELVALGPTQIAGGVVYTAHFSVNCVPEFTGVNCTTPATPTTTSAATLTTSATTLTTSATTLTTSATTLTPTTEGSVSVGAGGSPFMGTTEQTSLGEGTGVHPLSLGIGIVIGVITATVIALLVGAIAICCLLKRGKRRGSGGDADNIEMSRNPVYGSRQEDSKTAPNSVEYCEIQLQ